MILLQIVNGESWDSSREQIVNPSPEPSSPSSKNYKSEIENAWAFMLPDIYKIMFCKVQRRLKEICVVKQQPQEQPQKSYEQDILQKHLRVDRSLSPIRDACHDFVILLCVFGHVYASGTQDAEVTKSLAIWHISSVLDQYFVLTVETYSSPCKVVVAIKFRLEN